MLKRSNIYLIKEESLNKMRDFFDYLFVDIVHCVFTFQFCTMLLAVEAEAARIHLGERFNNFEDFDRCLDSWAVMHGCVVYKLKTCYNFRTRVCRFSKYVCRFSKKSSESDKFLPNSPEYCSATSEDEDENVDSHVHGAEDDEEDEIDWHYDSRYGEYSGSHHKGTTSHMKGTTDMHNAHAQPLLTVEEVHTFKNPTSYNIPCTYAALSILINSH